MAANFQVEAAKTATTTTRNANFNVVGGSFTLWTAFQASAPGNLLVAIVNLNGTGFATLTGWTQIASRSNSGTTGGSVFVKTSQAGTEAVEGTTGGSGGIAVQCAIYEVAGAVGVTAVTGSGVSDSGGGRPNPDPPAVTNLADSDYLIFAFKTGRTATSAGPSNMSNYAIPVTMISSARTVIAGTSFDPSAFTASSAYWNAFTVAIRGVQVVDPNPPTGATRKPIRYSFSF